MQTLTQNNVLEFSNYKNYSFADDFAKIINESAENYDSKNDFKSNLEGFFNDLQKGGCISGMIGEFIYHSDCKDFYIKNIDDLEEFKNELEEILGDKIENRHNLPHYTFMCWVCFEEFAFDIYSTIFEG